VVCCLIPPLCKLRQSLIIARVTLTTSLRSFLLCLKKKQYIFAYSTILVRFLSPSALLLLKWKWKLHPDDLCMDRIVGNISKNLNQTNSFSFRSVRTIQNNNTNVCTQWQRKEILATRFRRRPHPGHARVRDPLAVRQPQRGQFPALRERVNSSIRDFLAVCKIQTFQILQPLGGPKGSAPNLS